MEKWSNTESWGPGIWGKETCTFANQHHTHARTPHDVVAAVRLGALVGGTAELLGVAGAVQGDAPAREHAGGPRVGVLALQHRGRLVRILDRDLVRVDGDGHLGIRVAEFGDRHAQWHVLPLGFGCLLCVVGQEGVWSVMPVAAFFFFFFFSFNS
jgi:hypothetical protein